VILAAYVSTPMPWGSSDVVARTFVAASRASFGPGAI